MESRLLLELLFQEGETWQENQQRRRSERAYIFVMPETPPPVPPRSSTKAPEQPPRSARVGFGGDGAGTSARQGIVPRGIGGSDGGLFGPPGLGGGREAPFGIAPFGISPLPSAEQADEAAFQAWRKQRREAEERREYLAQQRREEEEYQEYLASREEYVRRNYEERGSGAPDGGGEGAETSAPGDLAKGLARLGLGGGSAAIGRTGQCAVPKSTQNAYGQSWGGSKGAIISQITFWGLTGFYSWEDILAAARKTSHPQHKEAQAAKLAAERHSQKLRGDGHETDVGSIDVPAKTVGELLFGLGNRPFSEIASEFSKGGRGGRAALCGVKKVADAAGCGALVGHLHNALEERDQLEGAGRLSVVFEDAVKAESNAYFNRYRAVSRSSTDYDLTENVFEKARYLTHRDSVSAAQRLLAAAVEAGRGPGAGGGGRGGGVGSGGASPWNRNTSPGSPPPQDQGGRRTTTAEIKGLGGFILTIMNNTKLPKAYSIWCAKGGGERKVKLAWQLLNETRLHGGVKDATSFDGISRDSFEAALDGLSADRIAASDAQVAAVHKTHKTFKAWMLSVYDRLS